ncbi:hypothetical protein ACFW2Y_06670 [Streptomyces sp. NPDC058877]|uniref:hypothetical protein n=1 Tax=Streptomyces sp. NPDC058877 TaxID=3346665 RepID=UPI00369EBF23
MTDTTPATPVTPTKLLHLVGHAEKRRLTPEEAARLREGVSFNTPEPAAPKGHSGKPTPLGPTPDTARLPRPDLLSKAPLLNRRVLTIAEQDALWATIAHLVGSAGHRPVPFPVVRTVVRATLNEFSLLLPPPAPDPGMCSSRFADHQGLWWQCRKPRHHNPTEGHAAREWIWADESSGREA